MQTRDTYPLRRLLASTAAMLLLSTLAASAADHLDAPLVQLDGRADINDVYVFQSPANPAMTVLVMTVNPAAGILSPTTFDPEASYEFKIDIDADAKEESTFKIVFGAPDSSGRQSLRLRRVPAGPGGAVLARGRTGEPTSVRGGGAVTAGLFEDPFFFDLNAFLALDFCSGGIGDDFFAGLNVSAIVLQVPSASLGPDRIGVWARTERGGLQIDRMGRPAINTVFIPNNPLEPAGSEPSLKDAFNDGKPRKDRKDFRGEVIDTLEIFYGSGSSTVELLADILLPDILAVDTSSAAGFLNGRRLADDVIDAELALVTNGAISTDCVDGNDAPFISSFPYLAPAN